MASLSFMLAALLQHVYRTKPYFLPLVYACIFKCPNALKFHYWLEQGNSSIWICLVLVASSCVGPWFFVGRVGVARPHIILVDIIGVAGYVLDYSNIFLYSCADLLLLRIVELVVGHY